jgi:hypothetical protein
MSLKTIHVNFGLSATLCAFLAISECAAQTPGQAQAAVKNDRESHRVEARVKTDQDIFDFHSGFWMNLHHFLYQQALAQKVAQGERLGRAARHADKVVSVEALNDGQKRDWASALEHYRKVYASRDLLGDKELVDINYRLAELENESTLKKFGLSEAMVAALELAATVYRAHWWKEHDRINRAWIAAAAPLVKKYGSDLREQFASAYREPWAKEPVRVEVAIYANWAGGYTTLRPTLVTISSDAAAVQGYDALETLFHEANHAMMRAVGEAIRNECVAQNKPVPRDLWHMTLFYTTGEIVKRALSKDGIKDYTPYAYKHGLYQLSPDNQLYQRLLEQHWHPYLDGKSDFAQAIKQMVAGL